MNIDVKFYLYFYSNKNTNRNYEIDRAQNAVLESSIDALYPGEDQEFLNDIYATFDFVINEAKAAYFQEYPSPRKYFYCGHSSVELTAMLKRPCFIAIKQVYGKESPIHADQVYKIRIEIGEKDQDYIIRH